MALKALQDISTETVGDRIRFFRKERGLTQEQLGLSVGAGTPQSAKAAVAKIEAGQIPGGLRLRRIAEVLRCSTDILLSGRSRELFEAIRYVVRPVRKLDGAAFNAFRAGRIFLHFAMASGRPDLASEFMEAANRLFYLAEHDPGACERLFKMMPRTSHRQLAARGDLREAIRELMRETGEDPSGFHDYTFAEDAASVVRAHRIEAEPLPATVSEDEGLAPSGEGGALALDVIEWGESAGAARTVSRKALPAGAALMRIQGDGLEPLARHGQYAIVGGPDRAPVPGDLVACRSRRRGTVFGRFAAADEGGMRLLPVSPSARGDYTLAAGDEGGCRVVVGILSE